MTRAFEFLIGVVLALVVARVNAPFWVRQVMGLVGGGICVYAAARPDADRRLPQALGADALRRARS